MEGFDNSILETFVENLPGAAFYYAVDSNNNETIEFLNTGCEDIWSVSADVIGRDPKLLWNMIHPDDLRMMQESVQASARKLLVWELRFRITDGSGIAKTLISRGTPEPLAGGGTRWLTFIFDISAQSRTERLFETVTRQLEYVSSAIPDGFALFDKTERLVVCNSLFRDLYGLQKMAGLKGLKYETIVESAAQKGLIPSAVGFEVEWAEKAVKHFRRAEGNQEELWDASRWMKILDRPTEDGGRVSFRIEITDAVRRKKELEHAAETDALTGALNRRGLASFLKEASKELGNSERLAVLHIDLDKFKSINDGYGHDAGDFVLAQTANKLNEITNFETRVARVGGDEFVVTRVCTESDHEIFDFAESLRAMIVCPVFFEGRICQVGASVGLAIWDTNSSDTIEQTLMDADSALLAGKSMGRNQTVLFDKNMREAAENSARIAAQIKEGLSQSAFEPFFQPQIELPSGRIIGFEALARWRREDGTYTSAASFINVANETGLIAEIEGRILGKSLDILKKLSGLGLVQPRVSINLSCRQLGQGTIVEKLMDEMFIRNLSTDQLNIEVLETTLLDDRASKISQNIHALDLAGFSIELDDFGTGHTALTSLTSFPVHRIKVDRSLIQSIDADKKKQAIVGGLYSVCEKLEIEAIAEGVETQAELNMLRKIGYTFFQGYYFAGALAFDDLLGWVEEWQAALDHRSSNFNSRLG